MGLGLLGDGYMMVVPVTNTADEFFMVGRSNREMPQWVETLPRNLIRWVCVFGVFWVFAGADLAKFPVDDMRAGIILTFVTAVYGYRGWEKLKKKDLI